MIIQEWKTNIIKTIYKKGEEIDTKYDRGISLLNMKLHNKIITQRLSRTIIINKEQQGFR